MRVVIALGGNAIVDPAGSLEADVLKQRIRDAAAAVADIARGCEVVITHGNGPQVGLLSMQSRATPGVSPYPLDVIGAESEGMIGYMLEREFATIFPGSEVATLLTQVEIDPEDPAFQQPSKPIGPLLSEPDAKDCRERLGWQLIQEDDGYRRVVPSPAPQRIRELRTIELLVDAGVLVVCAGGGGIPVVATVEGGLRGVEAVIDKDRTAELLASELHANVLLLLTNVPGVYEDWPEPREKVLRTASSDWLSALELDPGSMGPKVEAARRFVNDTGGVAAIGSVDQARRVLQGLAGTQVTKGDAEPSYW
jgi:carbamate kinase